MTRNFTLEEATAAVYQNKCSREVHTCPLGCSGSFSQRTNMTHHYFNKHKSISASNEDVIKHLQTQPKPKKRAQKPKKFNSLENAVADLHKSGSNAPKATSKALQAHVNSTTLPIDQNAGGDKIRVAITSLKEDNRQVTSANEIVKFFGDQDADIYMITEVVTGFLPLLKAGFGEDWVMENSPNRPHGHRHNVVAVRSTYLQRVSNQIRGKSESFTLELGGTNKCPFYYPAVLSLAGSNEKFVSFHVPGATKSLAFRYDQIKTAITDTDDELKKNGHFMMVMDANLDQVRPEQVNILIEKLTARGLSIAQAGTQNKFDRSEHIGEYVFAFRGYRCVGEARKVQNPPTLHTDHELTVIHTFERLTS